MFTEDVTRNTTIVIIMAQELCCFNKGHKEKQKSKSLINIQWQNISSHNFHVNKMFMSLGAYKSSEGQTHQEWMDTCHACGVVKR